MAESSRSPTSWQVFRALLRRDGHVAIRELPFFLLRTTLQPLMFVVVFGYLLPKMGFVRGDYGAAMLPGILAVSLAFSSVQAVALPLVADFGWTFEIEDRLLAPVRVDIVAYAKILSGIIQGVVAALFVLPVARLVMGPITGLAGGSIMPLLAVTFLGATAFSTLGLVLGTAISPQQVGLMFGFIVAPMIFFGCAYYPWSGLSAVPAMKVAVLINPLVYVAEGLRGTLTPALPHMSLGVVTIALIGLSVAFLRLGIRGFTKRAIS
jgi:ABC-2 type transport system permease protein